MSLQVTAKWMNVENDILFLILTSHASGLVVLGRQMARLQALRLRTLAEEAYKPNQYATNLSFEEADRRHCADRDTSCGARIWDDCGA